MKLIVEKHYHAGVVSVCVGDFSTKSENIIASEFHTLHIDRREMGV